MITSSEQILCQCSHIIKFVLQQILRLLTALQSDSIVVVVTEICERGALCYLSSQNVI